MEDTGKQHLDMFISGLRSDVTCLLNFFDKYKAWDLLSFKMGKQGTS